MQIENGYRIINADEGHNPANYRLADSELYVAYLIFLKLNIHFPLLSVTHCNFWLGKILLNELH